MKDTCISVIIPCYNVEKWVKKCLDSVLSQTHTNLQVIVVDDGSTDETLGILHSYDDYRVKIISQKNSGVSAARNAGISCATGDYIAFVDSDDWLEATIYEKLLAAATQKKADMAVCNYNLVYDDHVEKQYSVAHAETIDLQNDVYSYFMKFCACPKPNNYIWTRLYKTELVKHSRVRFENYRLGDDTLFNFKLLPYVQRVTWIPDGGYNYYQRKSSNIYTVAKKSNLAGVYADTFDSLVNHYEGNGFANYLQVLPIHAFTRLRSVFFYSRCAEMNDEEIVQNVAAGFKDRTIASYLTGKLP